MLWSMDGKPYFSAANITSSAIRCSRIPPLKSQPSPPPFLMKSSVASLIACHDNTYNAKRMTLLIPMSSTKVEAPPKIRWCFFSPIPYTYGLCVVCVLCVVREIFIYIMYILMNWEGTLHKEALRRQTA